MYRSLAELREGWTKNLVLLFPSPLRLAWLRLLEFALIMGSATVTITAVVNENSKPAIVTGGIAAILLVLLLKRIRRAHFSWDANALAVFGLPVFSYLLLRSRIFHSKGKVTWKGRQYEGVVPSGELHSLPQQGSHRDVGTAA
jgi:hypothetical protein